MQVTTRNLGLKSGNAKTVLCSAIEHSKRDQQLKKTCQLEEAWIILLGYSPETFLELPAKRRPALSAFVFQ
ncbi:hypothetical protein EB796_017339 [Bugula neritina]|uniref:Uncharacterized protein n=1 Tax=Bugula neritina TaxID=10212 RepID=A0A7J7JG40_BUGNE|nr:hypothetical protein EB796_017339 [Bugula neritina]